ncbi:hypothetical protein C0992_008332 [Termitomyces sp. T32_za158]|nr:hypothetical protein C0992_008332 [Termitomyces sp. T32_za158]
MDKVNEGKNGYIITASDWPSFLYDLDLFNGDDQMKGLMRGPLLLKVYHHIFMGPSSALSGHRSATKPCIAHLHGLMEVTGRTIAYVAVQAQFALSSMVVRLFESDPEQPWVIDTLRWWNTNVPELQSEPKQKRKQRALSEELGDRSNDAVEEVLQQWKAQETKEMSSPRSQSPDAVLYPPSFTLKASSITHKAFLFTL